MDLDFDVVDLGPADHPEEGETAPDFTRPLVNHEYWEDVALSEVVQREDGPTVLIFHPMDGAFPSTYIWNEVRERGWADDATVVGCAISTPYRRKQQLAERDLEGEVELYSDPGNGVAEQYGIVNDLDGMTGIEEPRPAVFVLDDDRTIEYAWAATQWPDFPDYDEVEAAFR